MTTGRVHAADEPPITGIPRVVIAISNVFDPARTITVEATVDTGYTGHLTLPTEDISRLGLTRLGEHSAQLADGSVGRFGVYGALVSWQGQSQLTSVFALESAPLLGMALLWGHRLTIDAQANGAVTIQEIPPG